MTATLETTLVSHLERNLACLGELNADLARSLRAIEPAADVIWEDPSQDFATATYQGRRLCSQRRPRDEAERIADSVDLVDHAVVVALGFGLGHHVRILAERFDRGGVIIICEPDLALLRAVFERIDMSGWLTRTPIVWLTDPDDRATLARKLAGTEAIIAQGLRFVEHPADRVRMQSAGPRFAAMFKEFVVNTKTTLLTTLVRSTATIQNLLWNLDHYVSGPGIADLENAAAGFPAVIASAGPSLSRNIDLLAREGVRERCIIIAVQTTLKPLLARGIRPHFVTALDYHEISGRFYEGLNPQDLEGITLIADPKAHPVILDSFPTPGIIRCCAAPFLDKLLGDVAESKGSLRSGATVAHLAFYFAEHLGCSPIAMIGQDLGFTDGLYYAPGNAIHEVWAPELNAFNTIEMMEWQRIARHRLHLRQLTDQEGKSIYTDAQMLAYLQQFERDFAQAEEKGTLVIDATEGGIAKQHAMSMSLANVLVAYAQRELPRFPAPQRSEEASQLSRAAQRVQDVRERVERLRMLSTQTQVLLERMLAMQSDQRTLAPMFEKLDRLRREVEEIFDAFELLNHLNQMGVFRRLRFDRAIHMRRGVSPMERQRAQLERDLDNVKWIIDAALEFERMLDEATTLLESDEKTWRRPNEVSDALPPKESSIVDLRLSIESPPARIAAIVPVDPQRNGLGEQRSLAEDFFGRPLIQATLERLGRASHLDSIILLAPRDFDLDGLIDRSRIGCPIQVERCDGSPFGPEQQAIAAARRWGETCWRGALAGLSIWDEVLCPAPMHAIMDRHQLDGAMIAAPDWPLIDPCDQTGAAALVSRFRAHADRHSIVFTQAPPGLSACIISRQLMSELRERNRLSTIGGLLIYQPHAPQADPIARDANVQIDHRVRGSLIRATADSPERLRAIRDALKDVNLDALSPAEIVSRLEQAQASETREYPAHIILDVTAQSTRDELFAEMSQSVRPWRLTLGGFADPLLNPQFDATAQMAREAGATSIHLRTDLACPRETLDRVLAAPIDVVSVNLNADRARTYEAMMGEERFREVLLNIEYLTEHRRRFTNHAPSAAFALPWIVPRLTRCRDTYEDIDSFFDRWQSRLGCAILEGDLRDEHEPTDNRLAPATSPRSVVNRELRERMFIRFDGSVPIDERHTDSPNVIGNLAQSSVGELWQRVQSERAIRRRNRATALGAAFP